MIERIGVEDPESGRAIKTELKGHEWCKRRTVDFILDSVCWGEKSKFKKTYQDPEFLGVDVKKSNCPIREKAETMKVSSKSAGSKMSRITILKNRGTGGFVAWRKMGLYSKKGKVMTQRTTNGTTVLRRSIIVLQDMKERNDWKEVSSKSKQKKKPSRFDSKCRKRKEEVFNRK